MILTGWIAVRQQPCPGQLCKGKGNVLIWLNIRSLVELRHIDRIMCICMYILYTCHNIYHDSRCRWLYPGLLRMTSHTVDRESDKTHPRACEPKTNLFTRHRQVTFSFLRTPVRYSLYQQYCRCTVFNKLIKHQVSNAAS